MNKIDLYKLSKDVLVTLISTIQEETKKRCRKDIENKSNHNILLCEHCLAVTITLINNDDEIVFTNNETTFFHCDNCTNMFCEEHIIIDTNLYTCKDCNVFFVN